MHKKPLSLTKLTPTHNKRPRLEEMKLTNKNTPKVRLMINSPKRQLEFYEQPFFKRNPNDKSKKKKKQSKASDTTLSIAKQQNKQNALGIKKEKAQRTLEPKSKLSSNNKSSGRLLSKSDQYKQLETKLSKLENRIVNIKNSMGRQENRQSKPLNILSINTKQQLKTNNKHQSNSQSSEALSELVTQVHNKHSHNNINQDPYKGTKGWYYISLISKCLNENSLQLARQHISQCLHTMKFMQQIKKPSEKEIQNKKVYLSKKQFYKDKLTVILDLDETLIHCNESSDMECDVLLPIKFQNGQSIEASINIRPFCIQFLKVLSLTCQVIIFTASHSAYANVVLDYLDPKNQYISHRLYRQNCYQTSQGIYVKDLRIINRDANRMVLVDNAAYSYFFQLWNGVPIIPYYEGRNDYQLQYLLQYLKNLEKQNSVMEYNKRYFMLDEYFQFKDVKALIRKLYPEIMQKKAI